MTPVGLYITCHQVCQCILFLSLNFIFLSNTCKLHTLLISAQRPSYMWSILKILKVQDEKLFDSQNIVLDIQYPHNQGLKQVVNRGFLHGSQTGNTNLYNGVVMATVTGLLWRYWLMQRGSDCCRVKSYYLQTRITRDRTVL